MVTSTPSRRSTRRRVATWRDTTDCVIYARLSTGERKNTRQRSIPDQIKLCTAAAERLGYRVVRVYQDGRSRGVRRQGLHDMLADLETMTNIGAIFIWNDTRLWGHTEQMRYLLMKLKLCGVQTFDSSGYNWNIDTPMDKLRSSLSAILSEYETGMTSSRIYDVYKERAADGEILQRPPYGVQVIKTAEGDKIISTWQIDPDAIVVVRRIFQEFASGKFVYAIARDLAAEGIETMTGLPNWSASNIRRLIDNPFYVGRLLWNRTKTEWEIDPVTGDKLKKIAYRDDEDIIEAASPLGCVLAEDPTDSDSVAEAKALWAACQERRSERGRERQERIHEHRPLDGLIRCARCGGRMHARQFGHKLASGERNPNYDYRCSHKANFGTRCSKSHTMAENKIFKLILAGVMEDEVAASTNPVVTWVKPRDLDRQTEVRQLRLALERAERAVAKVNETNEAGGYPTVDMFKERLLAVMASEEEARLDLAAAETDGDDDHEVQPVPLTGEERDLLLEVLPRLRNPAIDIDIRMAEARGLFKVIRIDNPRIEVELA